MIQYIIFVFVALCSAQDEDAVGLNECFFGASIDGPLVNVTVGNQLYVPQATPRCINLVGKSGSSIVNLAAAETTGLCNSTALPGLLAPANVTFSCCTTNSCNFPNGTAGATIAPIAKTYPNPIVCFESIYLNGIELYSPTVPSICYGYCARVSAVVTNGTANNTIDVYTCGAENYCNSAAVNANNNCVNVNGLKTCCCNTNLCLQPEWGIFEPGQTTAAPPYTGSSTSPPTGPTTTIVTTTANTTTGGVGVTTISTSSIIFAVVSFFVGIKI